MEIGTGEKEEKKGNHSFHHGQKFSSFQIIFEIQKCRSPKKKRLSNSKYWKLDVSLIKVLCFFAWEIPYARFFIRTYSLIYLTAPLICDYFIWGWHCDKLRWNTKIWPLLTVVAFPSNFLELCIILLLIMLPNFVLGRI